jgi:hypothetical protein
MSRTSAVDARLQVMLDHYEIGQMINEYCRGCDRMDRDRMAGAYAPDSVDDHGTSTCSGPDFADKSMVSMASVDVCSHFMGQLTIKVDGDSAGAESHFIATVRKTGSDGTATLNHLGGRYADQLERIAGRWQIKHRICVRDWSITLPITEDWLAQSNHARGAFDKTDPGYQVLSLNHSGSIARS